MKNEDYTGSFDNNDYSCIVISDGVSTCKRSREGAEIAVNTVLRLFRERGDILFELSNTRIGKSIIDEIRYEMTVLSYAERTKIEDYSTTVAFAVLQKKTNQMILFSLGNSTVLSCNGQRVHYYCKSDRKESGTCTVTTKNGYTEAFISRQDVTDLSTVCLMTDGAWDTFCELRENKNQDVSIITVLPDAIKESNSYDDSSFISMNFIC